MNKLSTQKRAQVVAAIVEGASINSTVRMTGVTKQTILRLIADLGTACAQYQDEKLRNLSCKRIQADEVWSFCHANRAVDAAPLNESRYDLDSLLFCQPVHNYPQ